MRTLFISNPLNLGAKTLCHRSLTGEPGRGLQNGSRIWVVKQNIIRVFDPRVLEAVFELIYVTINECYLTSDVTVEWCYVRDFLD